MTDFHFETLPDDIKEQILDAQSSEAGAMAEELGLQEQYGDYMAMMEAVEKRNKAIIEGNMEAYNELTNEMFGDM